MSVPETVSFKELQEKAKNSSLHKGMIVRCLRMHGAWAGFEEAEFYVLSDKAELMWGHQMAVRHLYGVDPDSAQMFGRAKDKEGNTLFLLHAPPRRLCSGLKSR